MKRFKRILLVVPELTPETSIYSWTAAIGKAAEPEGIDLLHCLEEPMREYPAVESNTAVATEAATELATRAKQALPGLPLRVHHDEGDPLRQTLARLAHGIYDLVIVSIHDHASRSLVERLARKSPVSVLALPPDADPPPTRISVGIDFSDLSPDCLDWAEAFASLADVGEADLEAVHAIDLVPRARATMALDPASLRNQIRQSATLQLKALTEQHSRRKNQWRMEVVESQWPGAELTRRANEDGRDLIVVGSHGRNALSIALLGSHACDVIRDSERPVFVVRRKNENLRFLRELLGMPG